MRQGIHLLLDYLLTSYFGIYIVSDDTYVILQNPNQLKTKQNHTPHTHPPTNTQTHTHKGEGGYNKSV